MDERDLDRRRWWRGLAFGSVAMLMLPAAALLLRSGSWRGCLLAIAVELACGIVAAVQVAHVRSRASGWLVALFALVGAAGPVALGYVIFAFISALASGGAWGRPLRLRGRILHPELALGSDWTRGAMPSTAGLDAATRRALEALWLHDAQKEHASVPAFSRLSWQLAAVGAPAELIADVHGAALEEIDHTRRCFALAAGYGGRSHTAEPMPELLVGGALGLRGDALAAIAVESVKDGCLLEDYNADVAAACARACVEPATRDVLERIAREERSHAELSWRVVAFCVARGGERVRRAVQAAFAELSRVPRPTAVSAEKAALVAAADATAMRRHGRLPDDEWAALWPPRVTATRDRLTAILADVTRAAAA